MQSLVLMPAPNTLGKGSDVPGQWVQIVLHRKVVQAQMN